jgi:hypothetical protein
MSLNSPEYRELSTAAISSASKDESDHEITND